MTHTQIKGIASQIARRVQAGLARRPRVNIKTLAAALALTVVGAGAVHAKCTFHYTVENLRGAKVEIVARETCKPDNGKCKSAYSGFNYEVDAGQSSTRSTKIARNSDTKIWYSIREYDGTWFKANRLASCQDTAASPVVVTIR